VENIQKRAGLLMDHLTLFGWFAVRQCLCYALEDRGRLFILGFCWCMRPGVDVRIFSGRMAHRADRRNLGLARVPQVGAIRPHSQFPPSHSLINFCI